MEASLAVLDTNKCPASAEVASQVADASVQKIGELLKLSFEEFDEGTLCAEGLQHTYEVDKEVTDAKIQWRVSCWKHLEGFKILQNEDGKFQFSKEEAIKVANDHNVAQVMKIFSAAPTTS